MGSKGFDGEDWLGSYLSTTKYARDPKLNADAGSSSMKKRTKAAPKPEQRYGPKEAHASDVGSAQNRTSRDSPAAVPTSGYNLAGPAQRNSRRRSWAAPPSAIPGSGGRANPAEAAAAAAIAAATAAAAAAASRGSAEGCNVPPATAAGGPGSPGSAAGMTPSPARGDLAALTAAAAAVVEFSGHDHGIQRKRAGGSTIEGPLEKSSEAWQDELGRRATNFRRKSFSGSGRRASLDYTDLEAVKERVQQAASLWAVAEDHERDSISSTGSNPAARSYQGPVQGPRAAAAAAQAAAAAAKMMGTTGLMEDDEGEDDADEEMKSDLGGSTRPAVPQAEAPKLSQDRGAAAASPGSSAHAPERPQKKVSLIKKWLVFRR